ncbi:LpxL/LpxP family Kdo(2)-lipid IV(A) lauroyl/palmitoleoyl acyltransferasee [Histophilus somni]|uniref:Lipid A biosynthesis acyltransferase n=1 Tax=Histophilus somni TaxID=731 RepID=A0AAX2S0L7_HISSO|nr:Kdo(2)-lipid IV(A) acyltransferase [Histophilus somni]QEH08498.1 LpxL/LpxP family Kdo(2)-lipid IV(A) lauroyl/palmitoleoyl acyltransferasee [Histophilus somni]QEH12919.1 LpxL/LpxP family Kdo(2)-lipid IV(A) lauroyl/palmitoleoyl acyltransferasee [Histophilus somni]QEH24768.1 LpxL/LpxP family Kdo(2)-lipid IV(A) lauroyl/palmitoleoyl acyltransferasee [Histophilus somni]QEH27403.1 LpxL/LpxP family Kdo(2)-lipid IV(A) lauroyl/palmitoleoyl acyltransferasee [Histophilus somni]QEH51604.1 LpxL/LpxP fami
MAKTSIPQFNIEFLKPKYWLFWLGFLFFRLILLLPYPILLKIGNGLGSLFSRLKIGQRRTKIARQNLQLCFPHYSEQEINDILQSNLKATGMAIIETGMAWFWSDKRIKKWSKIEGLEYLKENQQDGIILVGIHFLTLELGARIIGLSHPGIGIYRPHDNPLMDWLQCRGRARSNKGLLDRKDLRAMIKAIRHGEMIWYAPDHDYGRKNAVFVPFFAVPEAATTTGSYYLIKSSPKSKVIPFTPLRNKDNSGYTLNISAPVDFSDILHDETAIATRMNKIVEKEILQDVTQYMWLHRRFKTRPDEHQQSLYE